MYTQTTSRLNVELGQFARQGEMQVGPSSLFMSATMVKSAQWDRTLGKSLSVGFHFSLHDMKKVPFLFLLFSVGANKYSFHNKHDSNVSTNGISLTNALVTKSY